MSLFGQSKRYIPTLSGSKGRRSPLPLSTSDAVHEKYSHSRSGSLSSPLATSSASGWFTVVYLPLPRFFTRSDLSSSPHSNGIDHRFVHTSRGRIRVYLPIPPSIYRHLPFRRPLSPIRACFSLLILLIIVIILTGFRRHKGGKTTWTPPFQDADTCVLTKDEVARIWEWEILSGHQPSPRKIIPENVPLPATYHNPAIPSSLLPPPAPPAPAIAYQQRSPSLPRTIMLGTGPERKYLPLKTLSPPWDGVDGRSEIGEEDRIPSGYPPRPVPGSIADLDMIYEKCSFTKGKYVRDCLEYLRIGGNLDNDRRVRRSKLDSYRYIYQEQTAEYQSTHNVDSERLNYLMSGTTTDPKSTLDRRNKSLSRAALTLPSPLQPHAAPYSPASPCDPAHPRIFHMFWAGPFTDKPYMAIISFLFTQNLGLDLDAEKWHDPSSVCRPQFWIWINPGPAAAVPNPSAKREMYEHLATNPWSAPFLHARFKDVVKYKMWNTTEQLDGIDELRDHWRAMPIFNSGGNTYGSPEVEEPPLEIEERELPIGEVGDNVIVDGDSAETEEAPIIRKGKGGLFEKVGSTSENDYDRLSVILSDMARFVLTHRYGGIYLDADTIFMRDWEELWGWKGQFAYRWSWHDKYNTAVLKLHKGSALGSFLFKTALEHGMDFHPMTVSRYLSDAGLTNLLYRIPDALFDPAWLNMEKYQRDRPPFPYFAEFSEFFSNNRFSTGGPQPVGFDGAYRGAYSHHFHNNWWVPFDPSRNWPDLGKRFMKGERSLREAAAAAKLLASSSDGDKINLEHVTIRDDPANDAEDEDEVDLSWATVFKRTFEAYIRNERPNMYGEWLRW